MNSDPSFRYTGTVPTIIAVATPITVHFQRSAHAQTGSYARIRMRLIG